MQVGADRGYSKVHEGGRYSFCSRSCLEKFEADPLSYLSGQAEAVS